jgi:hypothetical protein
MASEELAPRSRRALLTAAAGAAGALAAGALIPAGVAATDPNDVVMGQDNPTTATTKITDSTADSTAFEGHATGTGTGYGLLGTTVGDGTNANPGAAGVIGWSTAAPDWSPDAFSSADTVLTGVFGYAPAGDGVNNAGSGVWGDSPDTGVFGTGATGVLGYGYFGVQGIANSASSAVGVLGMASDGTASRGVYGYADQFSGPGSVGVLAYGDLTRTALYVSGKAHFSRSGHTKVAKGHSSLKVTLHGVSSSSKVFAVLGSNASGRYIRAIVPGSGYFTVYFNTSLAAAAYVNWFILD